MKQLIVFVLLASTLSVSCNRNKNNTVSNWKGGYIKSLGKFVNDQDNYTFSVYEQNGLLKYNLVVLNDTVLK